MRKDIVFMRLALYEAMKNKGKTLPNPTVGAVLVKDGKVIAKASHAGAGSMHAEALAIDIAANQARGAELYVTLEPCNHYGRTPPCSQKIIKSGIKRVVIGARDPNPKARGGVETLKKAGIDVRVGVLKKEAMLLIDDFFSLLYDDIPFVSLKIAMTLDAKIADLKGKSKWITSKVSRVFSHRLRCQHQAVAVGIGTVLADDPLLNARLVKCKSQPKALVIDSKLRIPADSRLVRERRDDLIVVYSQADEPDKISKLRAFGVKLVEVADTKDLRAVLKTLRKELSILSVMFEAGTGVSTSLIKSGLFHKIYIFAAGKLFGLGKSFLEEAVGSAQKPKKLKVLKSRQLKDDVLIEAYEENFFSELARRTS